MPKCEMCGKGPQVGNNVSHANNRTRRRFLPNLQETSMFSDALQRQVQVRLSTDAIRTVEKRGGIDAYLLSTASAKLGTKARALKRRIQKASAAASA